MDVKPQRVRIGGLWKNTTRTGITYLSGGLSYDSIIEIWPNTKRDGKNDPDYQVFISQKIKKDPLTSDSADTFSDVTNDKITDVPF